MGDLHDALAESRMGRYVLQALRGLDNQINSRFDRLENLMSAASDYMTAALASLDVQLANLQIRLQDDAQQLADAVAAAVAAAQAGEQLDTAALVAAADRVQASAVLVAGLDQPTVVVDATQPDVVVEPELAEPVPAPAEPVTETPTDVLGPPAEAPVEAPPAPVEDNPASSVN